MEMARLLTQWLRRPAASPDRAAPNLLDQASTRPARTADGHFARTMDRQRSIDRRIDAQLAAQHAAQKAADSRAADRQGDRRGASAAAQTSAKPAADPTANQRPQPADSNKNQAQQKSSDSNAAGRPSEDEATSRPDDPSAQPTPDPAANDDAVAKAIPVELIGQPWHVRPAGKFVLFETHGDPGTGDGETKTGNSGPPVAIETDAGKLIAAKATRPPPPAGSTGTIGHEAGRPALSAEQMPVPLDVAGVKPLHANSASESRSADGAGGAKPAPGDGSPGAKAAHGLPSAADQIVASKRPVLADAAGAKDIRAGLNSGETRFATDLIGRQGSTRQQETLGVDAPSSRAVDIVVDGRAGGAATAAAVSVGFVGGEDGSAAIALAKAMLDGLSGPATKSAADGAGRGAGFSSDAGSADGSLSGDRAMSGAGASTAGGLRGAAPTARSPGVLSFGAATSPAAARVAELLTSPTQTTGVDGMVRLLQGANGIGRQTATLQLDPPELGRLRVEMRMQDGALSLRVDAQSAAVAKLIEARLPELREALGAHGISIDKAQVVARSSEANGANVGRDSDNGSAQQHGPGQDDARAGGSMYGQGGRDDAHGSPWSEPGRQAFENAATMTGDGMTDGVEVDAAGVAAAGDGTAQSDGAAPHSGAARRPTRLNLVA